MTCSGNYRVGGIFNVIYYISIGTIIAGWISLMVVLFMLELHQDFDMFKIYHIIEAYYSIFLQGISSLLFGVIGCSLRIKLSQSNSVINERQEKIRKSIDTLTIFCTIIFTCKAIFIFLAFFARLPILQVVGSCVTLVVFELIPSLTILIIFHLQETVKSGAKNYLKKFKYEQYNTFNQDIV
eukprot:TRINITY_DN4008_c0_g1_i1.p1 TRINITY_DN4008_c0_g1~~TRINITY_DN4008_c0_g1_i1.p1  ORF type:complete len:182 (+),score=18.93 TRINITY_DN4008_c0_g1_i1:465-1010(+)